MSSIFDSFESKSESKETIEKPKEEEEKEESSKQSTDDGRMKITRVFDFAGENVE